MIAITYHVFLNEPYKDRDEFLKSANDFLK